MNEIDDHIKDALHAVNEEVLTSDDDEQAFLDSVKFMFQGANRIFTFVHVGIMCVLITLIVVCAVQFFRVESTRSMIAWAVGFSTCVTLQAISELYFMLEINKHIIRWEVKRMQHQVAELSELISRKDIARSN